MRLEREEKRPLSGRFRFPQGHVSDLARIDDRFRGSAVDIFRNQLWFSYVDTIKAEQLFSYVKLSVRIDLNSK